MDFVSFFRSTAPYIHAHKDKTLVLLITGEALASENWKTLLHDLALLNSLGQKVIMVYGARPQINKALESRELIIEFHKHLRVTSHEVIDVISQVHGQLRSQIESQLSLGLINSPMHNSRVQCVSGNFVIAKPKGILEGVDLQFTGTVRRIDSKGIQQQMELGNVVLVNHLGYSPTGELFNLAAEEVAVAIASAIKADKMVVVGDNGLVTSDQNTLTALVPSQCQHILSQHQAGDSGYAELEATMLACKQGVNRCHLVPFDKDGSLLTELYTRDGCGTLVTQDAYDSLREATIDDVAGILELLRPLENQGMLVRRSRELLENEIDHFLVNERDGKIIGCAALYPFKDSSYQVAELACVAVHPDYRHEARGEKLLSAAEERARQSGLNKLFVLTTHTAHWFIERGFESAGVDALPQSKKSLYNYQRNSKVFTKSL